MARTRTARQAANSRKRETVRKDETSGVVRGDELYTLAAMKRKLDISDSALRSMINSGLKPVVIGKRKYFLGAEVLSFFQRIAITS